MASSSCKPICQWTKESKLAELEFEDDMEAEITIINEKYTTPTVAVRDIGIINLRCSGKLCVNTNDPNFHCHLLHTQQVHLVSSYTCSNGICTCIAIGLSMNTYWILTGVMTAWWWVGRLYSYIFIGLRIFSWHDVLRSGTIYWYMLMPLKLPLQSNATQMPLKCQTLNATLVKISCN